MRRGKKNRSGFWGSLQASSPRKVTLMSLALVMVIAAMIAATIPIVST